VKISSKFHVHGQSLQVEAASILQQLMNTYSVFHFFIWISWVLGDGVTYKLNMSAKSMPCSEMHLAT
jgi:hypothetical protein